MNREEEERERDVEDPEGALRELRRIRGEFREARERGSTDAIWAGIDGLFALLEAELERDRDVDRRLVAMEDYLRGYDPRGRPGPMSTEGYVPPHLRLDAMRPDVRKRVERVLEHVQKTQGEVLEGSVPRLVEEIDAAKDIDREVERLASSLLDDSERYRRVCVPTRVLLRELGYSPKTLKRYTDLLVAQGRLNRYGGAGGRREDNYVAFGFPPEKWDIWLRVKMKERTGE